jgi:chromate transporter
MAQGSALEVFRTFLRLGLTSFGGPVAHLGYFQRELVVRRRWVDEAAYADLIALCQFLPGPASSQVGFSLGLMRAGYRGGIAAWVGFTLPSALLLFALALGAPALAGPRAIGLLHGLKLVAVAVVAQAVWTMASTLCPDRRRAGIAILAAALILAVGTSLDPLPVIALGASMGLWLCRGATPPPATTPASPVSGRAGVAALLLFALLLVGLPLLQARIPAAGLALFAAFYRSGALVFGGGHVVLPLLQDAVVKPGWVSGTDFLAAYGAAQAVPGPLFTVAAWLGAVATLPTRGFAGAAIALGGIFLPGLLLVVGALPFWYRLRAVERARAAMNGVNAAVVGLLGAALYDPLWKTSVTSLADCAIALGGFSLLIRWRTPPLVVVILGALAGVALK